MSLATELWSILTRTQRRQVVAVQALAVIMALSTVTGIAAIAPFFTVLGEPRSIDRNRLLHWLYVSGGFSGQRSFVVALGVLFIAVVLAANLVNALGSMAMNRLVLRIGTELRTTLFGQYLLRPYSAHATTNSATLINNVVHETARVTDGILQSALLLISNLITASFIVLSILLLNPLISIATLLVLAGGYVLIYFCVRTRLLQLGQTYSRRWSDLTRIVSESVGGIKEILLLQDRRCFREVLQRTSQDVSQVNAHIHLVGQTPKHVMECVAVSGLVGAALVIGGSGEAMGSWLGELTFVAFAAYRLLPTLQQVYAAAVRIRADRAALMLISPELRQARAASTSERPRAAVSADCRRDWRPRQSITLREVSFQYPTARAPALELVNVSIPAGAIVGLVGSNGSGKTTLMDVIAGLLPPSAGELRVDGVVVDEANRAAWQARIAYVPQNVFLLDASIAQNIAFGVRPQDIDHSRMMETARLAQLEPYIATLPEHYEHPVGERGVRLSGGQRQRVGIARALYRRAPVLLLDEAMSALDGMTECELMGALEGLRGSSTIILVAHRLSMVRWCDLIFQMENGRVKGSGSFDELNSNSEPFRRIVGAL